MPAVHQIIVGASRRDAITNMALAMRDALRTSYKSEVYSFHPPDESVKDEVIPIQKLAAGSLKFWYSRADVHAANKV